MVAKRFLCKTFFATSQITRTGRGQEDCPNTGTIAEVMTQKALGGVEIQQECSESHAQRRRITDRGEKDQKRPQHEVLNGHQSHAM